MNNVQLQYTISSQLWPLLAPGSLKL